MSELFQLDEDRNTVRLAPGAYPDRGDHWRVGNDIVNGYRVSTVFLAVNHQYGDGPPLLFETMIFEPGTYFDIYCERYSTWAEAEAGHATAIEHAKTLGAPA